MSVKADRSYAVEVIKRFMFKFFGKVIVGIVVLFCVVCFVGGMLEDDYVPAELNTESAKLVAKLSEGGESLAEGYDGEYGIWGVEYDGADTDSQGNALRNYYTNTAEADNVTMMVYMVGSNLESEGGAATGDLKEMIASANNSNLNVLVQTGGANSWEQSGVSADVRQRWLIQNGQMTLQDELSQDSMCTRQSLADFVKWSASAYPADRYMLVLWDHGGGTMGGFGYDELYPEDTMNLSDMAGAVADSGIKLDMISFDACLMGTLEVGYAFEPYADYLLASEESEPGDGWYYTDALKALSAEPSMSTVEFGARLIDGFGEYYYNNDVTLSLMDLREAGRLYECCADYYQQSLGEMQGSGDMFSTLSTARSSARSYGDNEYEQVDLVDYVQRSDIEGAEDIIRSAFSMVKYRNDSSLQGSYGTGIYFPYNSPEYYQQVVDELRKIHYEATESFYNEFLSILVDGVGGTADTARQLTGYQDTGQEQLNTEMQQSDWYNASASEGVDYQTIQAEGDLVLNYDDSEEAYTLSLSEEEWDTITDIQLQVLLDDGEGYIDLGSDQLFEQKDNGDLIMDFDNIWTSIDGQLIAYYALEPEEDGDVTKFTGWTPAILNGEKDVKIYLLTEQDASGNNKYSVLGYVPVDEAQTTAQKGYLPLAAGDVIQFVCDYYTYDGEYDDQYLLGDAITVTTQEALEIGDYDLEYSTTECSFQLTDIYQQNWYTEAIEFYYED